MVHYKLTYFNGKGLGELPRMVFALAQVEYEDVRVEMEEWPKLQPSTPFHKLPILEEDGKVLAQSNSIARYLAKKFGLAGENAWEEAQANALVDQVVDCRTEGQKFFTAAFGFSQDDVEKLREEVLKPAVEKHLPFFVKALKETGSGFVVGKKITWADLAVAGMIAALTDKSPESLEAFPELKEHLKMVSQQPGVEAWLKKRPQTAW